MGSEVQGFISVPGLHLERVFSKRSQVLHMCVLRATSYIVCLCWLHRARADAVPVNAYRLFILCHSVKRCTASMAVRSLGTHSQNAFRPSVKKRTGSSTMEWLIPIEI